jgi:hypothetical protein
MMAKALECPTCGEKHRLDGIDQATTFQCERCGQSLKVPASVAAQTETAAATPTSAPAAASGIAPPPRQRPPGSPPAREIVGASATLDPATTDGGRRPPAPTEPAGGGGATRHRAHWYWRLLAWVVALPLGFVITAWPAYELGLIRKDDVLDVFVGSGSGRYTRLAIFTVIWALVTALLVQLFVEGGRWWTNRRRQRRRPQRRGRQRRRRAPAVARADRPG